MSEPTEKPKSKKTKKNVVEPTPTPIPTKKSRIVKGSQEAKEWGQKMKQLKEAKKQNQKM